MPRDTLQEQAFGTDAVLAKLRIRDAKVLRSLAEAGGVDEAALAAALLEKTLAELGRLKCHFDGSSLVDVTRNARRLEAFDG